MSAKTVKKLIDVLSELQCLVSDLAGADVKLTIQLSAPEKYSVYHFERNIRMYLDPILIQPSFAKLPPGHIATILDVTFIR